MLSLIYTSFFFKFDLRIMHGLEAVDFRIRLAPKIMFTQFQPIAKNFCPCLRKRDILYFTLSLVNVTTVNTTSILDQQLKRGPSRILADYLGILNDHLFGHSKTFLSPALIDILCFHIPNYQEFDCSLGGGTHQNCRKVG